MFHVTGESFGTKWFPYLFVARLFWAVCLAGLVSFSLLILGAFF